MAALITKQMLVGFTDEQADALVIVSEMMGMKTSQFVRHTIMERLVHLGAIENPMKKHQKPVAAATAAPAE